MIHGLQKVTYKSFQCIYFKKIHNVQVVIFYMVSLTTIYVLYYLEKVACMLVNTLLLDLIFPPTSFMNLLYCSSWFERSRIFLISSSLFLLSSSSSCFHCSSSFWRLSCSFCCCNFFHTFVCCFLRACLALKENYLTILSPPKKPHRKSTKNVSCKNHHLLGWLFTCSTWLFGRMRFCTDFASLLYGFCFC